MVDWQKVGRQFGAFGAGVAGRSGEFHENLSTERQDAMISDNRAVLQHLNAGNGDRALEILDDRLGLLDKLGADPSDTNALKKLITDGNMEGAIQESTFLDNAAVANGRLKAMPTAPKPKQQIVDGQLVTIGPDGAVATGIEGFVPGEKSGQTINIGGTNLSPDEQIELAAKTKRAEKLAEVRARGVGDRESADIAAGMGASRAIPNLDRSLALLGSLETGGVDAALLKAKQLFGIESGDEAELVNALSKNVIAQLKPVFGSQFTKSEGDWLKAIEAGPSKSTAGNIRLIKRGLALAKRRVEMGQRAAISAKDFRSAQEMEDFLNMDLSPSASAPSTFKFDAQGNQIK